MGVTWCGFGIVDFASSKSFSRRDPVSGGVQMLTCATRLSVLPLLGGVLVLTSLTGCVSGFEKFYTPAAGSSSPAIVVPPPASPQMYTHSNDLNADAKR